MGKVVLSIGIASYNRKEWTCKNIDNLLQYKKNDIEIIVCDNASDDGTWEALLTYHDKRLKVIRNTNNYGARYNYEESLLLGGGIYGTILNDRDTFDVDLLENLMKILRKRQYDIICAAWPSSRKLKRKPDCKFLRAYSVTIGQHPGMWFYSRDFINSSIGNNFKIDLKGMSESEIERYKFAPTSELDMHSINASKWYWHDTVIVKITDREREHLYQTREEKIPYKYPDARIERLEIWAKHFARDAAKEEIMAGAYWGNLRSCLLNHKANPVTHNGIKIAVGFYRKAFKKLSMKSGYSKKFYRHIYKITIAECCRYAFNRLMIGLYRVKMTIISKPILRQNYLDLYN